MTSTAQVTPRRILILRLSSIGDIVLTSPLIRILRRRLPEAQIDFAVKSQFVDPVRANPYLNDILPLDTRSGWRGLRDLKNEIRRRRYDLIIDIHNNFRTTYLRNIGGVPSVKVKKFKLQRFLLVQFGLDVYRKIVPVHQRYLDAAAHLTLQDDGAGLDFFIDSETPIRIDRLLADLGRSSDRPTVGLAPGAGFFTKRWPQDYFVQVAEQLIADYGAQIILLGNDKEIEVCRFIESKVPAVNAAGRLSLMESAAVLNLCDLVICNDTGLMHIASALKKPLVAIFGPTTRQLGFFPLGADSRVVENLNLGCRPCTHIGRHRCPKKHFKCMREIFPNQVLQAAKSVLERKSCLKNPQKKDILTP